MNLELHLSPKCFKLLLFRMFIWIIPLLCHKLMELCWCSDKYFSVWRYSSNCHASQWV